MANGTTDEKLARADRIAERSAQDQQRAEQNRQATANALSNMRKLTPGSEPYREEQDSVTDAQIGKDGVKLKTNSPWLAFGYAALAAAVAVAWLWLRR